MTQSKDDMEKSVAIILVNYNGYNDTINCVKSIRKSSYNNYRIIIVDNNSEDVSKLKEDAFLNQNASIIYSQSNKGFSAGNNIGIYTAKDKFNPDYYFILNNDTEVEPDTIKELVETSEIHTQCGISTGKILYFNEKDTVWAAGGKFNFSTGIADQPELGEKASKVPDNIKEITFCTGCMMLISRDVIKKVGVFDESYFLYAEDTDYCCRVLNAGYKIYYNGKSVIYHKVSASSGKGSNISQYYNVRNNFYIIKKYCNHPAWGYVRRGYRLLKEICHGNYTFGNVLKGYIDFAKGITGKVNI